MMIASTSRAFGALSARANCADAGGKATSLRQKVAIQLS
jgi:hypothetical protein